MDFEIYYILFLLVQTFIIELVIVWLFLRKQSKFFDIAGFVFLINLFTWPLAQLFYGESANFFIVEIMVVLVESLLIRLLFKLGYWKSLLISFVANLVSAFFGFMF